MRWYDSVNPHYSKDVQQTPSVPTDGGPFWVFTKDPPQRRALTRLHPQGAQNAVFCPEWAHSLVRVVKTWTQVPRLPPGRLGPGCSAGHTTSVQRRLETVGKWAEPGAGNDTWDVPGKARNGSDSWSSTTFHYPPKLKFRKRKASLGNKLFSPEGASFGVLSF